MQDKKTGATANTWGQEIARQAAQLLGLPSPTGNSNEILLEDGRCVIKSAHTKTAYIGITKTMLPRLSHAFVILQSPDNTETYEIYELNHEFLTSELRTPGSKSRKTQVFFRAKDIRVRCPKIKTFTSKELDNGRNYWVTTQWPPRVDDEPDAPRCGVYLPDGREDAGGDLSPGDLVAVYEAKKGRSLIRKDISGNKEVVKCRTGRQGIVALLKVTSKLCADDDSTEQRYTDGTKIWWRWYADAEQYSTSGFVSRQELNRILGYAIGNPLKGFGDRHSGLKKITREEFSQIMELFQAHGVSPMVKEMIEASAAHGDHAWGRGESEIHKKLKEKVAGAPSEVLGEAGLTTEQMYFTFATNDRADIILFDAQGRVIGVEIESTVPKDHPEGILQAIKYRYMAAFRFNKSFADSRSFLIAHSISKEALKACKLYGVECFIIPKD